MSNTKRIRKQIVCHIFNAIDQPMDYNKKKKV